MMTTESQDPSTMHIWDCSDLNEAGDFVMSINPFKSKCYRSATFWCCAIFWLLSLQRLLTWLYASYSLASRTHFRKGLACETSYLAGGPLASHLFLQRTLGVVIIVLGCSAPPHAVEAQFSAAIPRGVNFASIGPKGYLECSPNDYLWILVTLSTLWVCAV